MKGFTIRRFEEDDWCILEVALQRRGLRRRQGNISRHLKLLLEGAGTADAGAAFEPEIPLVALPCAQGGLWLGADKDGVLTDVLNCGSSLSAKAMHQRRRHVAGVGHM